MHKSIFSAIVALLLASGLTHAAEPAPAPSVEAVTEINGYPVKTYENAGVVIRYPAGRWNVEAQKMDENQTMIRVSPRSAYKVDLLIAVNRGVPDGPDPDYDNHPNQANSAFLMAMLNNIPKKEGTGVQYSIGTVNLPDYWDTSVRGVVTFPNDLEMNFEASHVYHEEANSIFHFVVSSQCMTPELLEDALYPELITEVYEILQSVTLK